MHHHSTVLALGVAILAPFVAAAGCPNGSSESTCNGDSRCCDGMLQCNSDGAACLVGCTLTQPACFPFCSGGGGMYTAGVCTTVSFSDSNYSSKVFGGAPATATTVTTTAKPSGKTSAPGSSAAANTGSGTTLTSAVATNTGSGSGSSGGSAAASNGAAGTTAGTTTGSTASTSTSKAGAAVAMMTEAPVLAFAAVLAGAAAML